MTHKAKVHFVTMRRAVFGVAKDHWFRAYVRSQVLWEDALVQRFDLAVE